MHTFWQKLLDTLIPPTECGLKIRNETTETFSLKYTPRYSDKILLLSIYHDDFIKSAITANKYHNDTHATNLLTAILATHIKNSYIPYVQLVPVPLSHKRQSERGYNQVEIILHNLHKTDLDTGTFKIINAISRPVHTIPQTQLNKEHRIQNVVNAFASNRHINKIDPNAPIWIIDDVATTGATLHGVKTALPSHLQRKAELIALAG